MSMKSILGMMLASRMASRGGVAGKLAGGGLGGLAAGSLLGRGLGSKAGLAALGYLAYKAYQDHQSRAAGPGQTGGKDTAQPDARQAGASGLGGTIDGIIRSVSDAIGGRHENGDMSAGGSAIPSSVAGQEAAEDLSEAKALLLLRAMITAANADGSISPDERSRIVQHAAAGDADDRATLERELANPRPLDELVGQVKDRETAEEFYLASSMSVEGGTNTHRTYLAYLRERLGLGEEDAAEIDRLAKNA